jgi:hypothetical protein
MKNNVCFMITTFNRSDSCRQIVESILPYGDVFILDDASTQDYSWVKKLNVNYRKNKINGGKKMYWQTVTALWSFVKPKSKQYKYFFMIPDDMQPVNNIVQRSLKIWRSIHDKSKICLNLYTDKGRLNLTCWTNKPAVVYSNARKTQWVDMAFMAERNFFDLFSWKIPEIILNWKAFPNRSSGVGRYISLALNTSGYSLWQCHKSLLIPNETAHNSKMNGWRKTGDTINQSVSGLIMAQIASIPSRVEMLKKTVESLRPQVDHVFVGLNNYSFTPDFLNEGEYKHFDNSTGDAVKFYDVENFNGYFLSCDDDLIYPSNYALTITAAVDKYDSIISFHGKKYTRPVKSFVQTQYSVRCLHEQNLDVVVDIPGTGVMAFHTDNLKL